MKVAQGWLLNGSGVDCALSRVQDKYGGAVLEQTGLKIILCKQRERRQRASWGYLWQRPVLRICCLRLASQGRV